MSVIRKFKTSVKTFKHFQITISQILRKKHLNDSSPLYSPSLSTSTFFLLSTLTFFSSPPNLAIKGIHNKREREAITGKTEEEKETERFESGYYIPIEIERKRERDFPSLLSRALSLFTFHRTRSDVILRWNVTLPFEIGCFGNVLASFFISFDDLEIFPESVKIQVANVHLKEREAEKKWMREDYGSEREKKSIF